jgi:hypothetical protein
MPRRQKDFENKLLSGKMQGRELLDMRDELL